jgi:dGTPase
VEDKARARVVCDYIAGMTDRFAIEEHRRLFDGDTL